MSEIILQKISEDLDFLKEKIGKIENNLEEIDSDLHGVRPEYIQKLHEINKEKFLSEEEFEKELSE